MCGCLSRSLSLCTSKKKKGCNKKMVTKEHKCPQVVNDDHQDSVLYGSPAQETAKVKQTPPPPSTWSSQPPIESTERSSYRMRTTEQDAAVDDSADSDDGAVDVPEAHVQEKAGAGCVQVPSLHVPSPPHMNETHEHGAPTQPPVDAQPVMMSAVLLPETFFVDK